MESEDSGLEREKKQPIENNDFICFGEYGSRWYCDTCPNKGTCKKFTHDRQESIYLKQKSKYRGRGKWRRKDLY